MGRSVYQRYIKEVYIHLNYKRVLAGVNKFLFKLTDLLLLIMAKLIIIIN